MWSPFRQTNDRQLPIVSGDLKKETVLERVNSKHEKAMQRSIGGMSRSALIPGLSYCVASASMVLFNKIALSSFSFEAPTALLLFQSMCCVLLSLLAHILGVADVGGVTRRVVVAWLPVSLLFVGMIASSAQAIKGLQVGMLTVLKNLTNLITIGGDYLFFGRKYSLSVWLSILLMLLSAVSGAITDLSFDAAGYFWQIVNCFVTAAYSLRVRATKETMPGGGQLGEVSMVFLNNLLAMPLLLCLSLVNGEMVVLVKDQKGIWEPGFLVVAVMTGVLGFFISLTSLWFLSSTTPTVYSLVGSLNKVPLAAIGLVLFSVPWSLPNTVSIGVGLAAGFAFAVAKARPSA